MTQSPARNRLRRFFDHLRRQLWWLVTLALLLLAVYVVLARQLLIMVPDFREQIESLAAERLGAPVSIGGLRGYLDGITPVFVLQDLEVAAPDAEGAPLTLRHVEFSIDAGRSLLARSLRLRQLWVSGLDLHLVRDEDGHIRLRGLEALGADGDNEEGLRGVLELVYRQQRLVLDDISARVDWPGLPPLRSDDLSVALVRDGQERQVALRLSARDRPLQLDVRLMLYGEAYRLEEVRGDAYLRMEGEALDYWIPEQWPLPVKPVAAAGSVELWGGLNDGQVIGATAVVATSDLQLQHEAQPLGWNLDRLDARFHLARQGDGYQLTLDELSAQAGNVGEVHAGPLAAWWDGRFSADTAWRVRAESLNATALREQLLAWPFPLPDHLFALREQLVSLSPSGQVPALYLAGTGPRITAFNGRFSNLSVAASGERPGIQGVSGWVAGTPETGVGRLTSPALVLDLPAMFREPLATSLGGLVKWQRTAEALSVQTGVLRAHNADARGEALIDLHLPGNELPPYLSLRADIREGNAAHAARYIPLERMGEGLADWLGGAFSGGTLERGRLLYEGPLRYERTRQQERTQQMAFTVRDLSLHYMDGWPSVEAIQGTVMIDGLTVRARDLSAKYLDSRIREGFVDVVDIVPAERPLLVISAEVDGPARNLQTVLHDTPLSAQLPEALREWQIRDGQMEGHLLLHLPLTANDTRREVVAQASLRGVGLHSASWRLAATNLTGAGRFSLNGGLQVPALTGELFGAPIKGSVRTEADQIRLNADGTVPVPVLRNWLNNRPWMAPLEGTLGYRASLALPRGEGTVRLQVDSDLRGVISSLPVPLGKSADAQQTAQLVFTSRGNTQRLNLMLDQLGAAQLEMDGNGDLRRGAVRFGARGAPMPEVGLRIDGWLSALDPLPWAALVTDDESPFAAGGGGAFPTLNLAVDTADLRFQGQSLGRGSLSVQQRPSGWHMAVASAPLAGELFLPQGYQARGEQPLAVEIERLHWPFSPGGAPPDVDEVLDEFDLPKPDPLQMPVADISLREVSVHGRDYGQWQAQVRSTPGGTRVSGLNGRLQDTTFTGQLDWLSTGPNGEASSSVSGSFRSTDIAALLANFGLESFIEGRDATGAADLHWQGSPVDFDYRRLGGSLSVEINNALLPGTDRTSALRLLGLINIGNTISRRLRLDFSDVVSDGLLADRIRGQFVFDGPHISTDNLRIRSSAAEFAISGTLGLEPQMMDYDIEVTLPLSSNLYAGCLAGPAACAGIFVVERLWGDRLEKMTSMAYHVSGSWDNPQVEEVQGFFGSRTGSSQDSAQESLTLPVEDGAPLLEELPPPEDE